MVRSVTMAAVVFASALALAAPASAAAKSSSTAKAHHSVAGTVEKVDGQTLTIKTSTKSESVMLSPTTHITEHGKAIQASQLSTGSHVSVKYTETNGQKQAQSVAVTPAATKTAKK
jgi:hypothetical protein